MYPKTKLLLYRYGYVISVKIVNNRPYQGGSLMPYFL